MKGHCWKWIGKPALLLAGLWGATTTGFSQAPPRGNREPDRSELGPPPARVKDEAPKLPPQPPSGVYPYCLPGSAAAAEADEFPPPVCILTPDAKDIDLASALKLAGVENPEILLARARVAESVALRQFAYAQALPTFNAGTNFDSHTGVLQQSSGNILNVNRGSLYLGMGANAIAAGTVNIPGLVYNLNVSAALFGGLVASQRVAVAAADSIAVRNQILLRVASAYVELLRAEGALSIAVANRSEAREIARITRAYAKTGKGRQADANRALSELQRRNNQILDAQNQVMTASAALAALLNLDPSIRLHAIEGWVVPTPLVPDPAPLPDLIAIGVQQRPELASRQAAIRAAFLELRGFKVLPFSPNVIMGYSTGTFGGGSNLVSRPGGFNGVQESRFDQFAPREDVDVIAYWTLQNAGLGNWALIRGAQARLSAENYRWLIELNRVRSEVAIAYARTHARFAEIGISAQAKRSSQEGFVEDLTRIRGGGGLPIEVLDSLRLLGDSRYDLLDSISAYNRAQFELYVALGQPPAKFLAKALPTDLVPPAQPAMSGQPGCAPASGVLPAPVVSSGSSADSLPTQRSSPEAPETGPGRTPEAIYKLPPLMSSPAASEAVDVQAMPNAPPARNGSIQQ